MELRDFQISSNYVFQIDMALNVDLHCDLAREIFTLPNKNLTFVIRFMVSGKEFLIALENFIKEADFIKIQNWSPGIASCHRYSSFLLKFQWVGCSVLTIMNF